MKSEQQFKATKDQQVNLSLAYLSYAGILTVSDEKTAEDSLISEITAGIAKVPALCNPKGDPDWEVVWGPAVYTFPGSVFEDNAMFVARQISQPDNYVVSVRGTNPVAISDWLLEDLRTIKKVAWVSPAGVDESGNIAISQSAETGLNVLLNKLRPRRSLPGAHLDLQGFLMSLLQGPIKISFTGHSLGGALAPVLGAWFRQWQGQPGHWDPDSRARLSVIAFAGDTPGNHAFAEYYNGLFGDASQRIFNELDVVPHAWQQKTLSRVADLYADAGIYPNFFERTLIGLIRLTSHGYQQMEPSYSFRWEVQKRLPTYLLQAGAQHTLSYPMVLGVPEVMTAIDLGWTVDLEPTAEALARLGTYTWRDIRGLGSKLDAFQRNLRPGTAGSHSAS